MKYILLLLLTSCSIQHNICRKNVKWTFDESELRYVLKNVIVGDTLVEYVHGCPNKTWVITEIKKIH